MVSSGSGGGTSVKAVGALTARTTSAASTSHSTWSRSSPGRRTSRNNGTSSAPAMVATPSGRPSVSTVASQPGGPPGTSVSGPGNPIPSSRSGPTTQSTVTSTPPTADSTRNAEPNRFTGRPVGN